MMKIDEERQELILSNGRRVDMHYVDDFLIRYTDSDIDAYLRSIELYKESERLEEIDNIHSMLDRSACDNGPLNERIQGLLNNLDKMKKDLKDIEKLRSIEKRHEDFKNKMRDFLIDWGSYLKVIQSSLSLSEEDIHRIESIADILFDFDFDNE